MFLIEDSQYKSFLESNFKDFLVLRGVYDVETHTYHYKLTLEIPSTFDVPLENMDSLPEILAGVEKNLIFAVKNPKIFQIGKENENKNK
jgi:hypothetical protein